MIVPDDKETPISIFYKGRVATADGWENVIQFTFDSSPRPYGMLVVDTGYLDFENCPKSTHRDVDQKALLPTKPNLEDQNKMQPMGAMP